MCTIEKLSTNNILDQVDCLLEGNHKPFQHLPMIQWLQGTFPPAFLQINTKNKQPKLMSNPKGIQSPQSMRSSDKRGRE